RGRWAAGLAAGVPVVVGVVTLAEYAVGRDLGIDQALFAVSAADVHGGRSSFPTAAALTLIGVALWFLDARPRRAPQPAPLLAVLPVLVALLGLLGHAAGIPSFYGVIPPLAPAGMSVRSAAVIVLLGAGVVWARPDGLTAILRSAGPDGVVARWL